MNNVARPVLRLSIRSPFFEQICSGKKIVEGRPFTAQYTNLIRGDRMQIVQTDCSSNCVYVEITRLTQYSSFLNMLKNEGLANCLPSVSSLEEGVKTYHSFPDYKAKELEYGVVAIAIKVHQKYCEIGMAQCDQLGPSKL